MTLNGSFDVKWCKDVLLGVLSNNFDPTFHQPPNSEILHIQKPFFFAQNTHQSWRKRHQNASSNRKQPVKISNFKFKMG